ncbi:flagellar hook-length control protein FliK [Desulfofalx alkaliphila]|uniref:flagellar hook-length control protein FliK n=1 Tax=Desulfofalx alkaliphila TaxID=105483 RepID=UPI0006909DD3|nr:flagellar hook-length control protein FliK [Desulfofalx alkaliphila]
MAQQAKAQPKQVAKNSVQNQQAAAETGRHLPAALAKGEAAKKSETSHGGRQLSTPEIFYLPLPIKVDAFKSALLYLRQYSGSTAAEEDANKCIFIKLETFNMGILWIGIEHRGGQGLVVRFVAEDQGTRRLIEEIVPDVKGELIASGYSNTIVNCQVQPGVQGCQDIDSAAPGAAVVHSLVDWEV